MKAKLKPKMHIKSFHIQVVYLLPPDLLDSPRFLPLGFKIMTRGQNLSAQRFL